MGRHTTFHDGEKQEKGREAVTWKRKGDREFMSSDVEGVRCCWGERTS
jgi:hypothetical protein